MTTLQEQPATFQNYIGNGWVPGSAGGLLENGNPAKKGAVLARFQTSLPQDDICAVDAASNAIQEWRREGVTERQRLARRFLQEISSAIFTSDLSASLRYIDEIEAALAHVNVNAGYKNPALPFGGWKDSGFGPPENSRSGLTFFVHRRRLSTSGKPDSARIAYQSEL